MSNGNNANGTNGTNGNTAIAKGANARETLSALLVTSSGKRSASADETAAGMVAMEAAGIVTIDASNAASVALLVRNAAGHVAMHKLLAKAVRDGRSDANAIYVEGVESFVSQNPDSFIAKAERAKARIRAAKAAERAARKALDVK